MIALALACWPKVLLADEPTTALDATVQIQVLLLLRERQRELGLTVIFVTHDIGVAVEVADRIAVMYGGRIVEMGPCAAVIPSSLHAGPVGVARRPWCAERFTPRGHSGGAARSRQSATRLRLCTALQPRHRRLPAGGPGPGRHQQRSFRLLPAHGSYRAFAPAGRR